MSSLGDLYFALGLDDKEFNNALEAAKAKIASMGADVSINLDIDASKVASKLKSEVAKTDGGKIKLEADVDVSKFENLKRLLQQSEDELRELESKLASTTSASKKVSINSEIESVKRRIAEQKNQLKEYQNVAKEVNSPSNVVQHVVEESAISEVKALAEAMSDLNAQMEVANRLREGQIEYNKKQKEEKDRIKEEKNALKEKTVEMERFSKAWMDVAKVQRDQSNEQEAKVLEERMRFSEQWMSAEKSRREQNRRAEAESLRQQTANAKASKKELKEQLSVIFQIEDAVRRLQTMKVKLNTSGIDQESEGYKKASNAIDDYIDKLQKLQGSGAKLSKKSISLDLKQGMREVTMEVNNAIAGQKRLNTESKKAEKSQSEVAKKAKQFAKAFKDSSNWASQFNNQITNAFSIYAIERFIRNLYTVGGEFQKQEIALRNMIGDAGKANILFERMKDLSVKSPFTFSELSSYTKQMAAYGIEYNELYDTTKRLADISAGVGVDMGRLILAYGQVRSAEVLRGQELRQFTEAGIPIVAELAKRLEEVRGKSVAIGEVFDAISKREISFGMVKDVLFDMTDPGGKFFKTQEELAESLAGKWSNLKDAWDIMIADIANGNNTILAGLADNLAWITRNWEGWLPIVTGVTLAIGSYKAIIEATTIAQGIFNAVSKANPWVALASIIGGAAFAIWGYASNSKTASEEMQELNRELEKSSQMLKDNESTALRYLDSLKAQNTSEERRVKLLKELEKLYPSIFEGMSTEQVMLKDTLSLKRDIATATKDMTLAEVDKAILSKQQEKDKLWKEDWKRLTTPGNNDKHSQNDARIKELESQITELTEKKVTLEKELAWKEQEKALNDKSTVEEYVAVYGEIGKAVKILRDAGIKNGNLTSPSMSDRDLIEYYEKLNSALREQETTMKNFKVGSDTYNKASASAEVYKKAIEAIDGVWNTKDGKDARREAERAAKERAKQELDAYIDALKERIKEISSKWSLFKELMDVTGNRQMALNLSELGNVGFKNELEHLRSEMAKELSDLNINISAGDVLNMSMDELNKAVGDKDKLKRIQTIYDAYHNANRSLRAETIKDFAEIIKASRDFEAKIAEIERKLQEDLSKLREGAKKAGLSTDSEEYKRAEAQLHKEAEREKAEVQFEEFKESSNWIRVFDDLDRVSNDTLDNMSSSIEEYARNASLSEEVTKQLVEAMRKLREETIERNPFESFSDAWDRLKNVKDAFKRGKQGDGFYYLKQPNGMFKAVTEQQLNDEQREVNDDLLKSTTNIINKFNAISDAAELLAPVFRGLGVNVESLTASINNIVGGATTGGSVASAFGATGPWGAIIGAGIGMISAAFASRDNSLQRQIEASQSREKALENVAKNIQTALERTMGGAYRFSLDEESKKSMESIVSAVWVLDVLGHEVKTDRNKYSEETRKKAQEAIDENSYFDAQWASMLATREELQEQLEYEESKKNANEDKIEDYKQSLKDIDIQISDLAKDIAEELYGIDFKGWADQLAETLVSAWENGEDAAQAYKNKVNEILRDVGVSIISQKILQPLLNETLEKFLTQFEKDNGVITDESMLILAEIANGAEQATKATEAYLEGLKRLGIDISAKGNEASDGLSKGIQSVTEDTANLLGSYLNAIRQSVHVKQQLIEKLVVDDIPKINYLSEAQLRELSQIQINTARNVVLVGEIRDLVNRVVDKGSNKLKV